MDEGMEDSTVEYTFTAIEIDLDYEFDAVRFFDFTREESLAEARRAELWFDTAETYPPSPFVAKLIPLEGALLQNVNTSPKSKHEENVDMSESDSDSEVEEQVSAIDMGSNVVRNLSTQKARSAGDKMTPMVPIITRQPVPWTVYDCLLDCIPTPNSCLDGEGKELNNRATSNLQHNCTQNLKNQPQQLPSGLTFYDHMMKDNSKAKTKISVKPFFSRMSTLMKPTASQLAKQNQCRQMGDRLRKLLVARNEKISQVIEIQAAKRRKLEGGHLFKVNETKQQMNFVHKEPKRVVPQQKFGTINQDGNVDGNGMQGKLRLTIPREPDLETAHRAQRIRARTGKETERTASSVCQFKALPLNRKIFEAPPSLLPKRSILQPPEFQEFHLKTSERAMQHTSGVSVTGVACSNPTKELHKFCTSSAAQSRKESKRPSVAVDASKQEVSMFSHNFKALPLNRKIFSSKGDMGVFRNNKRDVTVPMEFKFHTDKRAQHNPPTELFNKLSLTSEPQSNSGFIRPQPACLSAKGSKENRWDSFQHENHEVKHAVKENSICNGLKQNQFGSNGRTTDFGLISGRSLGIR